MKTTTSDAVIKANRQNAIKSTGPRTPEGKEICRLNALKHGFSSKEVLIKGESPEEFDEFRERLAAQLQPAGELEEVLVDRIVAQAWRLRRAVRIEREILERWFTWTLKVPRRRRSYHDDRRTLGEAVGRDLLEGRETLTKYEKYEITIERSLFRTLHELERLQAARKGRPVAAPIAIDVEART